jgi:hypothetical protein
MYAQLLTKREEASRRKGFREHINKLLLSGNVGDVEVAILLVFTNYVIGHVDVFLSADDVLDCARDEWRAGCHNIE